MSGLSTRALHDRLIENLTATPGRAVARTLPGGALLDVDSFERRLVGAERRLVRIGAARGMAPAVRPDAGDLVLLSARNSESYLVAVATLWKRGFVPLLADADLARGEIADLIATFRPAFCLLDRRIGPLGGTTESLGESLAGLHAFIPARRADGRASSAGVTRRDLSGAAIVRLTSGTTGRPRGVLVSPDQLLADAQNICATMGLRPNDTMVAAIPLGHAYGFGHVLMSLVLQGTRPLLLEQPLPSLLIEALSGPGPLVLPGTPYLFDLLLQVAGRRHFKGLRLCVSAGAPLPEELSRRCHERLGLPVRTFYGASECGGISYDRSRPGIVPDGCVGTPLEGVEVRLLPVPGAEEGLGRVSVTGRAVALGYWPPEAGRDLGAGVFVTSDLGRLDETGNLRLCGRIDRLINVSGRKVNPLEVELVIRDVPGVRDVTVFGVPDRQRGQAVCAAIVAAKGLRRDSVLEICRSRLAPFKMPRRVEFVSRLPVNGRGKSDRPALASLFGGRPAGRTAAERPVFARRAAARSLRPA
ncbi:MAG TPA: class I adenylate-forming enzyme family protein [Candidatus Polarisedimenticolia bacterium]|nr:class I adenylate-forming enzyme family protein [Candidatus Polarisedimenticolia bacterium]